MKKLSKKESMEVKGGSKWSFNCPYCGRSFSGATQCLATRYTQIHVRAWHVPTYPVTTCP